MAGGQSLPRLYRASRPKWAAMAMFLAAFLTVASLLASSLPGVSKSFTLPGDWRSRRQFVSSLTIPAVVLSTQSTMASAVEGAPAPAKIDSVKIVRPTAGTPLYFFELPTEFNFIQETFPEGMNEDLKKVLISYANGKELASLSVGPMPPIPPRKSLDGTLVQEGFIKSVMGKRSPFSGDVIVKKKFGVDHDDLEMDLLAQTSDATGESGGRTKPYHQWFRILKGPDGTEQALMSVQVQYDNIYRDAPFVNYLLNSFKLGA